MRLVHMAATAWVVLLAFAGALGPRGLLRALPEWWRAGAAAGAAGGLPRRDPA